MKSYRKRRVIRHFGGPFTKNDSEIVRRRIKKHHGKIIRVSSDVFTASFPSEMSAQRCAAGIHADILKGPPAIPHGSSGAGPARRPRMPRRTSFDGYRERFRFRRDLEDRPTDFPRPEDFLLHRERGAFVDRLPKVAKQELASWLFREVELSENEKLVIVGLLGELGFSCIEAVLRMLKPFEHYRERELQDRLKFLEARMREGLREADPPGHLASRLRPRWWRVPETTKAHELLTRLEETGIAPLRVLGAVAMGPEEMQRSAAEALAKAKEIASKAIAKYKKAAKKLCRPTRTLLKQRPIFRVYGLLRERGFSKTQAEITTAEVLRTLDPQRFGNLNPAHVRLRVTHAGR